MPVRNGFIERLDPAQLNDPPLAVMLRGGQGGAVRLKLLLSLLWFSVGHGHSTDYPARSWAALLGLSEHETNGARRVTAAIDWLQAADLIEVEKRPGVPSRIVVCDERGQGRDYILPFYAWEEKIEAGEEITRDDLYVTLPPELWTKGWITVLTGPALAMLLVMRLEAAYSRRLTGLWHSPKQAAQRFGLSPDTRKTGLAELTALGILDKHTKPVSPGTFDKRRRRNIYDLHLEQLNVFPGQPRPAEGVEEAAVITPQTVEAVAED